MNRGVVAVGGCCVALGLARTLGWLAFSLPGGTYGFVTSAAVAAVVAGVALHRDGREGATVDVTAPPARRRPVRPGVEAADAIADLRVVGRRATADDGRTALRERLQSLAVDVLVAKRDVTPATARDRLEAGDWTDDPEAAAFFADGTIPALSTRDQLAALRSGDPPFARRARRVLAELDELEGDA